MREQVKRLTDAEMLAQTRDHMNNPQVRVSHVKCWCGEVADFGGQWLMSGDSVSLVCSKGHRVLLRFLPETIGN